MKKVLTLSVLAMMMMTFSVANAKTTRRNRVTKKTVAKKVTPKKVAPKKVVQKTAAKPAKVEKPASSTCGVPAFLVCEEFFFSYLKILKILVVGFLN